MSEHGHHGPPPAEHLETDDAVSLLSVLGPAAGRRLDHIVQCERCRGEIDRVGALESALAPLAPRPGFGAQVMAAVPFETRADRPLWGWRVVNAVLTFGAAVYLLGMLGARLTPHVALFACGAAGIIGGLASARRVSRRA